LETFLALLYFSQLTTHNSQLFLMNYVRHLNAFFSYVKTDTRLTASHVSLYMALFHYWNFNRFQNPFYIYRENIMQLSKIGSKNTYHKCIKELHSARYIFYHPATSKYQPIRISVVRLDVEAEQKSNYRQLDLFAASPKNETQHVPILTDTSTDFDTTQVPKMGQNIKPNINKQRETPTHEIFKRNKKIQNAVNDMAHVPHLIPATRQEDVENYFKTQNYPAEEAIKFFSHYKSLEWKLQGKTPILDWKPLVEKWMQNAKKWESPSGGGGSPQANRGRSGDPQKDLQYLYDSFIEGKRIFQYILTQHFDQLKLQLTDEILQKAWKERINQVSGTNQHSLDLLLKAYLTYNPDHELIQKDKPNFIALAKRIAVINHFHKLKNESR
jgi:hypothetical protein